MTKFISVVNIEMMLTTKMLSHKVSSLFFLLLFLSNSISAQNKQVKGEVFERSDEKKKEFLAGANVYWLNTSVGAVSDADGQFEIEVDGSTNKLVVSFIGYQNDTIEVDDSQFVSIELKASVDLNNVDIVSRQRSTVSSYSSAIKVDKIGEKELLKAACCNLSESFETSPSVDVSFSDAVTGTRQIQLLGLAGPYTQIMRENMPDVRGLSSLYGLTFTPGTWVKSISLNKGTGSVVNGFESIAGQINVELQKPEDMEKLYLNAYVNQAGRVEGNANVGIKISEKWSTAVLLHAKNNSIKQDRNGDGFLDMPIGTNLIGLNRWKFRGDNGLRLQFGIKGVKAENQGGQVDFDPANDAGTTNHWGMKNDIERIEGWLKIGKVFIDKPSQSFGLQVSGLHHDQKSYFGLNDYSGIQNGLYSNFIFQNIIGNSDHLIKVGASFILDEYKQVLNQVDYNRTEYVPGAFMEYTFTHSEKFSAVAGLRYDYNNLYDGFVTPRLHLRYAPYRKTVLRASAGRGQRTANLIAENMGLLASSRQWLLPQMGLNPEVAWNMGLNVSQDFEVFYREGNVSVDYYYTNFENQIIVDRDFDSQQVLFYNLDGQSYSHSAQIQFDYELINRLDLRLAYRWFDVKSTYTGELLQKPLVSQHRAFINLAYQTKNYWSFDLTVNWQGEKRIPNTASNPIEYQLAEYSPSYVVANMQISKNWNKTFEIYAGVENLFDFRQDDPILSSEDPFGPYFDASMVWGPIFGRNVYAGLRFYIR